MKTQTVNYNLEWGIKIPIRDGISLSANIYIPKDKKAVPVIINITPYIADSLHSRGSYFAQNEFIYLAVAEQKHGT